MIFCKFIQTFACTATKRVSHLDKTFLASIKPTHSLMLAGKTRDMHLKHQHNQTPKHPEKQIWIQKSYKISIYASQHQQNITSKHSEKGIYVSKHIHLLCLLCVSSPSLDNFRTQIKERRGRAMYYCSTPQSQIH